MIKVKMTKKGIARQKKKDVGLSSEAKFYHLKEIPFEPTGAAATKYPYVPPEEFAVIEEKIKEVMSERKLYMLLLKAPQGGGKTSTAEELKKRVAEGRYSKGKRTVFISNKLIDLKIKNYATDFIKEASAYLDKRAKHTIKKSTTPTQLKNILVEILKDLGRKKELVVWVIDEFDILVDHPKPVQSKFLQFIRNIVDDLADESLPIMFLMSHTWRSSREFEDHLKEVHKPFRHRIVESLEIGYTYDEVKKIVATRLYSVAMGKRKKSSISPFTEEALSELYESIVVSLGGTEELTDFRIFERCCYYSILRGAQKKLASIDASLVRQIFEEQVSSEMIFTPEEEISARTKSEMITAIRGPPVERLESALTGLEKGLNLSQEFSEISLSITDYVGEVKPNIHISYWFFSGKHAKGRFFRTQWFMGFKPDGIIVREELARVNKAIQKFRYGSDQPYPHLTILTYVSDIELDTSDVQAFDEVLRISRDTMRKLIGLGVAVTGEDIATLRKDFDSEILPNLREIYAVRVRDITKKVTDSVIRAIVALHINHLAGEKLTRQSLKEQETYFSGKRILGDRWIREMIDLGFASESGTSGLIPETPRSIRTLLDSFKVGDALKIEALRGVFDETLDFVLDLAEKLGILEKRYDDVKKRHASEIEESIRNDIEEAESLVKKMEYGEASWVASETVKKILVALEKSKTEGDEFSQYIVLYVARRRLPKLNRMIKEKTRIEIQPRIETETRAAVTKPETGAIETRVSAPEVYTPQGPQVSLEDGILRCLEENPLTHKDLQSKLAEMGFTEEEITSKITPTLLKMIIHNKLKITI